MFQCTFQYQRVRRNVLVPGRLYQCIPNRLIKDSSLFLIGKYSIIWNYKYKRLGSLYILIVISDIFYSEQTHSTSFEGKETFNFSNYLKTEAAA